MANFKEIEPSEFHQNPFKLIGQDWMLITAESGGKANTMTAAWGGLGVMWGKNVAYVVIRPQRYTKEFVDQADSFSLAFLPDSHKETLTYLGTKSGRDEDKIAKSKLTLKKFNDVPYFDEANMVIICKKLYHQAFRSECFTDQTLNETWYPESDYHTMYIAEITNILVTE